MSRQTILVVDDDKSIRTYLAHFLASRGYAVDCLESGEEAVRYLTAGNTPAVALLDIIIPDMSGLEILARVKKINASIPVIILSAMDQIKTVVEAMRVGASDYLVKPFDEQELELAIANVIEKQQLRDEVKTLRRQLDQFADQTDIFSLNPRMLRLKEIAKQVADTDVPVLILGESGVGKEVIARYIYGQTRRREKAFVKVNCAALPHDLLESELFGYERGAFTGALREKPGKFELADQGCILLDEIAEMSPQLQAKLLHVLQDGEYTRLGAKRSIRVDSRVLASTNKRLEEAVARGEFREDLYFRLNVIRLEIPPLRERKEDIPLLCKQFFQAYSGKYRYTADSLPRDLVEAFCQYDWPGNVRQLENAIKRYLILPDLEMAFAELKTPNSQPKMTPSENLSLKDVAAQAAEQAEREVVLRVLEDTNWNRKQSARRLGICYKALLNKLKKWQLDNRARGSASFAKAS